jgi:WD40 repeat protein
MNLLFAVMLALAKPVSAGLVQVFRLKQAAELPATDGAVSPDFTLFASIPSNDPTIGVWRLSDGHQVASIRLPSIPKTSGSDFLMYRMLAISPNDESVLIAVSRAGRDDHDDYLIYRASIADESAKLILTRENLYSRPMSDPSKGIAPRDGTQVWAEFSPDSRRVAVWANGRPSSAKRWNGPQEWVAQLDVVEPDGKVVQKATELERPVRDSKRIAADEPAAGARYGGFDATGRLLGLLERTNGCEIWDLDAQRRVSFLDGCEAGEGTVYTFPSPFLISRFTIDYNDSAREEYRLWDLATGKRLWKNRWSHEDFYAPTADGAFVFSIKKGEKELDAWRTDEDRNFAIAKDLPENPTAPQITGFNYVQSRPLSPDADRLLLLADNKVRVYELQGLGHLLKPARQRPLQAEAAPVIAVDVPPVSATKIDPDAYAVVIGIEKYRQSGIPSVDFAAGDARAMYGYLIQAMGFDAKNVVLLTDDQASKTDLEKNLGSWLKNRVGPKSRVFIYYAGHGSPNPETGQGYLMPYEADPAYLEDTAYPLTKLYAALGKLPTKDVTVVLDACFSGQGQRSLIAKGTRPLVSVVQSKAEPNTVVLAAAGANQVSASFPDAHHGLLTYYLLAGLHGEADAAHDGKITAQELFAYVRPAVERAAKLQNVEQTPTLFVPEDVAARPWIVLTPKK